MKRKVLIYGYTNLGLKIAKVLNDKEYKIIVIDFNKERLKKAVNDGFKTKYSTLLNDDELIKLGVKEDLIDSLFCLSDSNKNNLFVTLSARNLSEDLKIVSTSKTKAEAKKLMIAGATKVLNPNEFAALRIYRHISKPRMLRVLDEILFSESDLNMSELYITKDSLLNNTYLEDITIQKEFNILILGLMDKELGDNFVFNTKGINHKIDEGDILVVLGKDDDLERFSNQIKGVDNESI